ERPAASAGGGSRGSPRRGPGAGRGSSAVAAVMLVFATRPPTEARAGVVPYFRPEHHALHSWVRVRKIIQIRKAKHMVMKPMIRAKFVIALVPERGIPRRVCQGQFRTEHLHDRERGTARRETIPSNIENQWIEAACSKSPTERVSFRRLFTFAGI